VLRLAARVAGGIVGALAGVAELVSVAASGITAGADRRVHVPVPGVHLPEAAPAAVRLEELIAENEGVHRAEVNASLGHVVVTFDPQRRTEGDVARMVEAAAGLAAAPRVDRAHPGAPGPLLRASALLAAHLSGTGGHDGGRGGPAAASADLSRNARRSGRRDAPRARARRRGARGAAGRYRLHGHSGGGEHHCAAAARPDHRCVPAL
jgi:hypothetical protein